MDNNLHNVLALSVNSVANMTLSNLKQALDEVKYSCPAWFGLLHPQLLLGTKGVLAVLEGGDNTKVPGTNPSYWKQICSEFSNIFEPQGTPHGEL